MGGATLKYVKQLFDSSDTNMTGNTEQSHLFYNDINELNNHYTKINIGGITFVSLLMVLGILGNAHVIYIYASKFKQSNHRVYILCLAVVDMTTCCMGMPFVIFDLNNQLTFEAVTMCKSLRFFNYFMCLGSAFILVVIAVDRYRRLCKPFHGQMSIGNSKCACLLSLVISASVSWPAPVLYGQSTVDANQISNFLQMEVNITGTRCYTADKFKHTKFQGYFNIVLIVLIVCCALVIGVLYGLIARKVIRSAKKLKNRYSVSNKDSFVCRSSRYFSGTAANSQNRQSCCNKDIATRRSLSTSENLENRFSAIESNVPKTRFNSQNRQNCSSLVNVKMRENKILEPKNSAYIRCSSTSSPKTNATEESRPCETEKIAPGRGTCQHSTINSERQETTFRQSDGSSKCEQSRICEHNSKIQDNIHKTQKVRKSVDKSDNGDAFTSNTSWLSKLSPFNMDYRCGGNQQNGILGEKRTSSDSTNTSSSTGSRLSDCGDMKNHRKNFTKGKKVTKMLFVITLVYVLSFVTHFSLKIVTMLNVNFLSNLDYTELFLYNTFVWSFFVNNMANPIIYGFCVSKFRKEFCNLYKRKRN